MTVEIFDSIVNDVLKSNLIDVEKSDTLNYLCQVYNDISKKSKYDMAEIIQDLD